MHPIRAIRTSLMTFRAKPEKVIVLNVHHKRPSLRRHFLSTLIPSSAPPSPTHAALIGPQRISCEAFFGRRQHRPPPLVLTISPIQTAPSSFSCPRRLKVLNLILSCSLSSFSIASSPSRKMLASCQWQLHSKDEDR
jgi:hypothetical protein